MNNENKKQQEQNKETKGQTPQNSSWKSAFGKRWTFPVIYLAASVLIVGLMYAKSQDAAPYEIDNPTPQAGPQLPSEDAVETNATPEFMWPVGEGGEDAVISLDFYREGATEDENAMAVVVYENTFTPHEGVDIGLRSDANFSVVAAAMGTVKSVKVDPLMGHTVEIDHGNGYSTYYASLSAVEVKEGAKVIKGQPIAKSGNSRFEKSEKNHLHFELRKDGKAVDPNGTLPKKPSAYESSKKNAKETTTETPQQQPANAEKKESDGATNSDATKTDETNSGATDASKPAEEPKGDAKSTGNDPLQKKEESKETSGTFSDYTR